MKKIRPHNGVYWYLRQPVRGKRYRVKVIKVGDGRKMIFKHNARGECILELR